MHYIALLSNATSVKHFLLVQKVAATVSPKVPPRKYTKLNIGHFY